MATETERKFLIKNETWRGLAEGILYRQAYLNAAGEPTVRVRTIQEKSFLTIKGPSVNATRLEFEYEIPYQDGLEMLHKLAVSPVVEKKRHSIPYAGFIWEVDEFLGENSGLIFAEIELESADHTFEIPPWIGREVTDDPRFYNSNLARNPFSGWLDKSL
jgi:CYTH domain-containing protein